MNFNNFTNLPTEINLIYKAINEISDSLIFGYNHFMNYAIQKFKNKISN